MRSTKLLSSSNVKFVIPNKKIAEAVIENFSHAHGIAGEVTIGLVYGTPPEKVAALASDLAREVAAIEGVHPEVSVLFRTFGDSSLNLRVTFFVQTGYSYGNVLHAINLRILQRVHENGANFAFPTRTVHIAAAGNPSSGPPAQA
jgi:MscS family membrane protein